ncbi:unnamed protein product [Adineta steineri]|uniref:MROH2B-like HEAT-repeats domain-containing protein n=1 Tax=Adineta steineri TaxID=433720 RepID=A0A815AGE2_9BILA|nr:unnamed protein product [Adineta steineri]
MLKFLSKTLDVVEREDWISDIGACFVKQLPLYTKLERERGFAYKCIGIVLRKSKIKEFVSRTLESMTTVINFQHENERNGWAAMFGLCSATHLDIVLQRLELYLKITDSKGSGSSSGGGGGLFGFLGSKTDTSSDLSRATALLAYAYVSIYAPLELIVSRLETSILTSALKIARQIREETGKLIVAKSFVILAQSMNKEHLKTDFVFASRNDLVQEMVNYIAQETNVKLQPLTFNQCIRACHALIVLQPGQTLPEKYQLARAALHWYCSTKLDLSTTQKDEISTSLSALIIEILSLGDSHETFPSLVNLLEPFCLSVQGNERARAFDILSQLIQSDAMSKLKEQEQMTERQSMETAFENDLKKAASLKLYGDITRSTSEWKPNPLLCKRMNIPNPYSDDAYDDSKESKKSRRQLCSNLFEHLFTSSTTEPSTAIEQSHSGLSSSSSLTSNPNEIVIPSLQPPRATSTIPVIPQSKPSAPKLEFVPIESFDKENQERPPLDFFSAIFDNQDSDEDNVEEQETEEKKNDDVPKSINTQSSITMRPISLVTQQSSNNNDSDSSDSSIEEIEALCKVYFLFLISIIYLVEILDKSPQVYGPTIPSNLPSRVKTENDNSIWTKLANTDAQFEELKEKKKHKKKKKHHKKNKKHHH